MSDESRGKDLRVLIVDDEKDICELLEEEFKGAGFLVWTANSVAEALEIFERQPLDSIITDIRMPGQSGVELLDTIKAKSGGLSPTILCVTAYSDLTPAVAYFKGADGLFVKPIDMKALVAATIHFGLQRRQRLEALRLVQTMKGEIS